MEAIHIHRQCDHKNWANPIHIHSQTGVDFTKINSNTSKLIYFPSTLHNELTEHIKIYSITQYTAKKLTFLLKIDTLKIDTCYVKLQIQQLKSKNSFDLNGPAMRRRMVLTTVCKTTWQWCWNCSWMHLAHDKAHRLKASFSIQSDCINNSSSIPTKITQRHDASLRNNAPIILSHTYCMKHTTANNRTVTKNRVSLSPVH